MNTDIRISVSFRNHRKRKRLKLLLGPGATDYLLDLWIATAMNHPTGILSGMDETDIALEAGWEGDPAEFCRALLECKFLERDEEGTYFLHDWEEHQPWVIKAEARSEKARNAVNAKWGTTAETAERNRKRSERLAEARRKGTHTEAQWKEMVKFFGSRCVRCGAEGPVIRDHITPIYQGGSDGIENIQPTCKKCNSSKGPEAVDYRLLAAGVRGSEMPSEWLLGATGTPAESLQNAYSNAYETPTESLRNASPSPFLSSPLLSLPESKTNTLVAVANGDVSEGDFSGDSSEAEEDPPEEKIIKPPAVRIPYGKIVEFWNEIIAPRGKPRITELSDGRKRAIKALWRDRPTADFRELGTWEALFRHCTQSEILMEGGWFVFDWILKPGNFLKVLESIYHGGRRGTWGNR
jgi:5-methylcytosine-specific restriction endonuclease McrA